MKQTTRSPWTGCQIFLVCQGYRYPVRYEIRSGPVSRVLYPAMQGDDHSSGPAITDRLEQPTRKQTRATLGASLFGLAANGVYRAPVRYRPGRGALTAPFHPYHSAYFSELWRSVFCGTFPGSPPPDVIRRSALCSPDFPRQEINIPAATIRATPCAQV